MPDKNIFKKFLHVRTGQEFDIGYLNAGTYVETMGLDGPKLMLEWNDPESYLKDDLNVREMDEVEVQFSDDWSLGGMDVKQKFTVLKEPTAGQIFKINLISSPMYKVKTIADQTRIFRQRGIPEIITAISGLKVDAAGFPVVENYHCIAGERPSAMLKQISNEQGAHIWFSREGWKVKTFDTLFAQEPSFEYHYNKHDEEYQILNYTKASTQMRAQEQKAKSFTGWNDVLGRVKSPPGGPVLNKVKKLFPAQAFSQNVQTLGKMPIGHQIAVDFTCHGNGYLIPGMTLKLWWHQSSPDSPLDESLPDKVVIFAVGHYYSAQKYYCRIKGAVAFEPTS